MARYIDADKFLSDVMKKYGCVPLVGTCTTNNVSLESLLQRQPTADVAEVVRCKDCKHWIWWADEKRCSCDLHHIRTHRDDFCSYGERAVKYESSKNELK